WVSGTEPVVRGLRPGNYEMVEVVAPGGYSRADQPVRFTVRPGEASPVTIANAPLPAPPPTSSPPTTSPAPSATPGQSEATAAAPLRRVSPEQPVVPRLPETGQAILVLTGAGLSLVLAGLLLAAAGSRCGSRPRRRVRSLLGR
ncbi:MAG TPA: SpaA isopeptide-forming pilin-related protein, partial [Acidimicrobiales bacterium]|nr:SpaA isopeptide-forming pilin-related protein [Acidimicrobiales bacterium]